MKLTASNLVAQINKLDKDATYDYINPATHTQLNIVGLDGAEGPIRINRWNPTNGQTRRDGTEQTISTEMIWRIANAFTPGHPINFDRILAGSYNTRSAFETLLAHTPKF